MTYRLNLAFDHFVNGEPYPNLVPLQDLSQGYKHLGSQFPFVVPLRLLYYSQDHNFPIDTYAVGDELPAQCFYPIGLGFFSFDVDYFNLIPTNTLKLVRQGRLHVLFYYHEGDNPAHEKTRLDELCLQHDLSNQCYRFVSGNTAAANILDFFYFADHELFYWRANKKHKPLTWQSMSRSKKFTMLSRTHKWWRAAVVADLHRSHMLDNAYWSYNTVSINENSDNNPIDLNWFPGLPRYINQFLADAPYKCDELDSTLQNQHHTLVPEHFQDSYFQIVVETMFDADQSGGTFLTEKTFKPIKHAQPFILVAPPNSLATLKSLGYRTFDHCIINGYDQIENSTYRWINIRAAISSILIQDLDLWIRQCEDDARHNQQLFWSSKYDRLNTLTKQLNDSIN